MVYICLWLPILVSSFVEFCKININSCWFSAFGKSDFHKRYKHAISNCYQVKMTGEMLPRPNTNDEEVSSLLKCPYFIDDVSDLFFTR